MNLENCFEFSQRKHLVESFFESEKKISSYYFRIEDGKIREVGSKHKIWGYLKDEDIVEMFINDENLNDFLLLKHSCVGKNIDGDMFSFDIPKENAMEILDRDTYVFNSQEMGKIVKYSINKYHQDEFLSQQVLYDENIGRYFVDYSLGVNKNQSVESPLEQIKKVMSAFEPHIGNIEDFQKIAENLKKIEEDLFSYDDRVLIKNIVIELERIVDVAISQSNKDRDKMLKFLEENSSDSDVYIEPLKRS